jgi:hypothetical protein
MLSDNTSSAGTLPTYSCHLLTNRGEAERLLTQQKTCDEPKRRLLCIRFLECHCRTVTRPPYTATTTSSIRLANPKPLLAIPFVKFQAPTGCCQLKRSFMFHKDRHEGLQDSPVLFRTLPA